MAAPLPDATSRWRCSGCGNLTRFDVTRNLRTTEYWHFDMAGNHTVEELTTDHEDVGAVTCRWCGRSDTIELVPRVDDDGDHGGADDTGGTGDPSAPATPL